MAKLKAPLLSLGAHGTIADAITIQRRARGRFVRDKPIPSQPHTDRQEWHRYLYKQACQYWQTLTSNQKRQWETDARPYHMTGFAYFMRYQLRQLKHLLVCYPFDEPFGIYIKDFSGNLRHGTIYGALHVPGLINKALWFDGINDYVLCNTGQLNLLNWTVELIVKRDIVYPGVYERLWNVGTTGWFNFGHFYPNTGWLEVGFWATTGALKVARGVSQSLAGTFYHLAASWDGQYIRLYFEGDLDKTSPDYSAFTPKLTPEPLTLARTETQYSHRGIIDEFRIYDIALSATDIKMHAERRASE